ncbi:MAG: oligosaccharide flippase family protein, partial [Rhizobacter sp.]|nr:oligosaccharide flippase family protein [Chlorobiales bacterium]
MSALRPLLKDSTIYGLGSIAPKVVSYLLVPYYAYAFSVAENGVLNVLLAGMTFAFIFFTHGTDDAYLRSVSLPGERDHRLVFSTAQFSLASIAFGLSMLGILFASPLAAFIGAAS